MCTVCVLVESYLSGVSRRRSMHHRPQPIERLSPECNRTPLSPICTHTQWQSAMIIESERNLICRTSSSSRSSSSSRASTAIMITLRNKEHTPALVQPRSAKAEPLKTEALFARVLASCEHHRAALTLFDGSVGAGRNPTDSQDRKQTEL